MKINTQVEINEEHLKVVIAEYFVNELGLVDQEHYRHNSYTYMSREVRKMVIDLIKKFLKENKEEIIEKVVKSIADKFDHATYKKQIINALLKEGNNDC